MYKNIKSHRSYNREIAEYIELYADDLKAINTKEKQIVVPKNKEV